ncbi:MAG: MlaD family protein [Candidatus Omnitrophica bacterium]|nr:MlaD family protein [Candidatus Omnitrophota bacterium]MDD5573618.1 MlaD family protein [Candidatus Omnitrophota bacterium]
MIKKANKRLIGAFVVGAVVLFVAAIVFFGSGLLFPQSDKYVLYFEGSVKGLSEGSPVIFKGVQIGNVDRIHLVYHPGTGDVLIATIVDVELSRVEGFPDKIGYPEYKTLIERGLKARLDIQNFITNQLMISFDFYPDKEVKLHGIVKKYPELPALPTSPDIFELMNELPIKEIADSLEKTVEGINKLVSPEGLYVLEKAVGEVTMASRSMRLLAEYLEEHPEAIIKGKQVPRGGE